MHLWFIVLRFKQGEINLVEELVGIYTADRLDIAKSGEAWARRHALEQHVVKVELLPYIIPHEGIPMA